MLRTRISAVERTRSGSGPLGTRQVARTPCAASSGVNSSLENVGNVDYRIHGSGSNMPGRNLVLSLTADL